MHRLHPKVLDLNPLIHKVPFVEGKRFIKTPREFGSAIPVTDSNWSRNYRFARPPIRDLNLTPLIRSVDEFHLTKKNYSELFLSTKFYLESVTLEVRPMLPFLRGEKIRVINSGYIAASLIYSIQKYCNPSLGSCDFNLQWLLFLTAPSSADLGGYTRKGREYIYEIMKDDLDEADNLLFYARLPEIYQFNTHYQDI